MSDPAMLSPGSEEAASEIIAESFGDNATLAIQGGGTKVDLGRPVFADNIISSVNLAGVTNYNPAELVIGARAGTPLTEICRELAANGQRLPFEPVDHRLLLGSRGEPSIGAVAAINNSGPRRIQSGAARDSLLGVRFVNGRGQVIKNGGRVMKNVTGLDLVKLLAGSWGTLGFITEATFKVLPAPETEQTLLLRGLDDESAATAMAEAMACSAEISGAAHLPDLAAAHLIGGGAATSFRIEGFEDSVNNRLERLSRLFAGHAAPERLDAETSRTLWAGIRDVTLFAGRKTIVWRVSMKPSEAPNFVMSLRMKAAIDAYYDWQGGLVWLSVEDDNPHDDLIRAALARHGGGHAMLVRANSQFRLLAPVFQPEAAAVRQLSERIRRAFDPAGVFNPGRMVAA